MPSIPQSLLWISLVVLWLFVLVPMLISKRDAVRRTSDVALATRVLNSGRNAQRLRRGPAAGHHSDPHWRPSEDELDHDGDDESEELPERSVVVAAAVVEPEASEPDYLDVDVVDEDSGALPVGASAAPEAEEIAEEVAEDLGEPEAQTDQIPLNLDDPDDLIEDEQDGTADEYEYVADTSGLEGEAEGGSADEQAEEPAARVSASRQRRYESKTAAEVSARKYTFRRRVLSVFAVVLVFSATAAFLLSPAAWWVCGATGTVTVLYLAYLRRQTRIEEQLRRRRAQRVMRSRLGVENTEDPKLDVVPARLRRPGSVVLEIDDEDPIFEHLDHAPYAREYDLPRAAGQ